MATIGWSQHPHMSSQHNKNTTTSHFDTFTQSSHLQIAWLMCLCVDIHVALIIIVLLIMDELLRWG